MMELVEDDLKVKMVLEALAIELYRFARGISRTVLLAMNGHIRS
jgi:hypothetical protein